jgi:hypothetical protein
MQTYNNQIQLTVKSVMFFTVQKIRPFLRQVILALYFKLSVKRYTYLTVAIKRRYCSLF